MSVSRAVARQLEQDGEALRLRNEAARSKEQNDTADSSASPTCAPGPSRVLRSSIRGGRRPQGTRGSASTRGRGVGRTGPSIFSQAPVLNPPSTRPAISSGGENPVVAQLRRIFPDDRDFALHLALLRPVAPITEIDDLDANVEETTVDDDDDDAEYVDARDQSFEEEQADDADGESGALDSWMKRLTLLTTPT